MDIDSLWSELSRRGISLTLDGDRLRIRAPAGAMTDELRDALTAYKSELIALLQSNEAEQQRENVSIPTAPRQGPLPLSHAQEGLWLIYQLEGGGPTYNLLEALRLRGRLDVAALERALGEIVRRHEILRTTFAVVDREPAQRIAPPGERVQLTVVELQQAAQAGQDEAVRDWAREEVDRPFDLSAGPLIRFFLLRLAPDHHLLAISVHHIICDAWSLRNLVTELAHLYEHTAAGQGEALAPLPIQYADFAVWHRQRVDGAAMEAQRTYWKQQLANAPASIDLPTDRPRPPTRTFNGAVVDFTIDAELTRRLAKLAQERGVTAYMVLLGALATLLARHSGQRDILIGSPVSHRTRDAHPLIGFFVNTMVMRLPWENGWNTHQLLDQVKTAALGAYAHKDVPFAHVVQDVLPSRDASYTPLFQVLFAFLQGVAFPPITSAGVVIERYRMTEVTAKFDLNFSLEEAEGEIIGRIEYSRDIFEPATVARLAEHFLLLLRGMTGAPEQELATLEMFTPAERAMVIRPAAAGPTSPQPSVLELFAAQAAQRPDAPAARLGDQTLSYRELDRRTHALSRLLRERGVRPGDLVGLYCERSLEMLIGVLGIMKAGAGCLPLDVDYPQERLAYMWADSRASLLLTQEERRDRTAQCTGATELLTLDTLALNSPEGEADPLPPPALSEDALAYLLFTSGSTGRPKGVAMSHRAFANLINWQIARPDFAPGLRTLQFAPSGFDVCFQELFSTWASGGCLILISEANRREPSALIGLLRDQAVERLFLPYVVLEQLARASGGAAQALTSLREIYVAGEQLRITPVIRELFSRLKGCTLHNQYGPTETHVVTSYRLPDEPASWPDLPPIGAPIANVEIHLLDAGQRPVPVGPLGELYVGGAALANGYLHHPELTAERFIELSAGEGATTRLYKTGDLARWRPDGTLQFGGRADEQVKIRGFRVEPGEIEAALAKHPGIAAVTVNGHTSASGDKLLVAYYVPKATGPQPAPNELQHFVAQRLPEYMVPSFFLKLAALPLTPSGKVDRRALPPPSVDRAEVKTEYVAPRTPVERALAAIWSEVLEFDLVGVHDDFFELGGHSLRATQLLSWVMEKYSVELTQRRLFEEPTIAAIAQYIEQARIAAAPPPAADAERVSGEL